MRRVTSIAMVAFGLGSVLSGGWQLFFLLSGDSFIFPPHIVTSALFVIFAAIHMWLNRKPLFRYFKGLRWWWILVGVLFGINVIWIGIVLPMLIIRGWWGGT
jgi:hypothetical protein